MGAEQKYCRSSKIPIALQQKFGLGLSTIRLQNLKLDVATAKPLLTTLTPEKDIVSSVAGQWCCFFLANVVHL